MNLSTLIARNLQNKRHQYIIIGLLFFILNMCVFTTVYLAKGLSTGIEIAKNKLGADIIITSKDDDDRTMESIYDGIPTSSVLKMDCNELETIQGVTKYCKRLFLATLEGASCCDNKIQLIAVEQNDYLLQDTPKAGYIIIGSNVTGQIGQTVTYYDKDFIVADVLDKSGTGYDYSGFISYADANAIIESKLPNYNANDISAVFISSNNPALTRNILNNRFGKDVSVHLTDNKIAEYTKTVSGTKVVANLITVLLVTSSILAITTIMSLMFLNRRNEVGVLILSGFSKKTIHTLFLSEAVIVTMIAAALSFMFFCILSEMNKSYFESMLHCPIGTVNNGLTLIVLLACSIIFVDIIIRTILNIFYKKDACTLIKEVN